LLLSLRTISAGDGEEDNTVVKVALQRKQVRMMLFMAMDLYFVPFVPFVS